MSLDSESAPAALEPSNVALYDRIPLDLIVPARKNRETINEAKLQELTTSIARIGVMQPILVRPLPGDRVQETSEILRPGARRPEFEIVYGERRWRASQAAALKDIPAIIRNLDDREAAEAQLVENLQREDLHPLDEADGYQRLCETAGLSKEQVAERIGKSRTYVYNRLKLKDLCPESRQAFIEGRVDASKAELLATVAQPKLQLKALKEFTEGQGGRGRSYRECKTWLELNVLLKIEHAPFDTKDKMLLAVNCPPSLEGTGACTTCPKRTHNDRDLFAAFDGPDMCTDPACFRAKEEAHLGQIRAKAEAQGLEVIAGKDAKKLKPHAFQQEIKGYTRLDQRRADIDPQNEPTVADLLGRKGPKPVLFVDPHTHQAVKVLPTEVVEQALKDKGLLKPALNQRREQANAREQAKRELEIEVRRRAVDAVNERLESGAITAYSAPFLRNLLHVLTDPRNLHDRASVLLRLWRLPAIDGQGWEQTEQRNQAVRAHIEAVPDERVGILLLQYMLAGDADLERYGQQQEARTLELLASESGVKLSTLRSAVKAELKAAQEPPQHDEPPPPGATSEAAPQGSDAPAPGKKPARRKPAGGAPKLTALEAKSGIAEAMQNMEGPVGEEAARPLIAVDTKVRVRDTVIAKRRRWIGKEGTVLEAGKSAGTWVVYFTAALVDRVTFAESELEVVSTEGATA